MADHFSKPVGGRMLFSPNFQLSKLNLWMLAFPLWLDPHPIPTKHTYIRSLKELNPVKLPQLRPSLALAILSCHTVVIGDHVNTGRAVMTSSSMIAVITA